MTDEQMFLWMLVAVFIAFAVWTLIRKKDVIITLAIKDKATAIPPVPEQRPKHHGFSRSPTQ